MGNARKDRRRLPLFCTLLLLLTHLPGFAVAASKPEPVYIGDAFRLQSKVLDETRRYLVHLPADYAFVKEAYPVLILLDGDQHFQLVSATVDLLAGTGRIPSMIVVGVANTNRSRDLLPVPQATPGAASTPDGPKRFLDFISDELIPEIDRTYRTRPYRVLVGHSLGGLFAVYSWMNEPETFKGYIAISPAFADNRALVKEVEPFLVTHKNLQADFYMTMANEGGQQLGGAWELSSILQEKAPRELRWQFQRHPEETHFSVVHRSVYDGLQSIFQGWYVHDPFALYEQGGFAAIEKHYAALSARAGYEVQIPERTLTFVLNSLSSRGRFAEGEPIVKRVLATYPESSDVHFTLGRFFYAMKDQQRAITHLTRLLELYPDNNTARRMLVSLGVDAASIAPTVDVPAATLASYHGRYRAAATELQITEENGRLYAITALDRHRLRPMSTTRFYCVDGDKQLTFNVGASDRVTGLVVHQAGQNFEMTRLK